MWFLYLLPDLTRSTGAVEDPVDEADSEVEDDDEESAAEGVAKADVRREQRQQQEGSMVAGEGVGGAVVEVEGVEPIEDLLCRDDIAR